MSKPIRVTIVFTERDKLSSNWYQTLSELPSALRTVAVKSWLQNPPKEQIIAALERYIQEQIGVKQTILLQEPSQLPEEQKEASASSSLASALAKKPF